MYICTLFQPQTESCDSQCLQKPKRSRHFFSTLEELYVFFSGSAVHARFIDLQREIYPNSKLWELKITCFTRWTVQASACLAMKKTFEAVLILLNVISSEMRERRVEATRLLEAIDFKLSLICVCLQKY